MGRKKKKTKLEGVQPTPLQEYVIREKTKHCLENGWEVTPENFDRIHLYDVSGRIDNYIEHVRNTWGRNYAVNEKIIRGCKGNGMPATEVNRLMREEGW